MTGRDLSARYDDPRETTFRAVVDLLANEHGNGFRDEYGVWFTGPSEADAELAARIMEVIEA